MKTIRDAVHGDIQFTPEEMSLIDTAPMQRLRGIKQLGASNLVFPSAVHTRFEHTLGACWLTKRLLSHLARRHQITEAESRNVCLAALLHDITHVPFGHTFEDERRLFDRHDEDPARLDYFLQQPRIASLLGEDATEIRRTLLGQESSPAYARELVTGTVCADLLDYLKRDAFHCGLRLDYDDRLYHYFDLQEGTMVVKLHKEAGFRRDALSELIHLLQIRYSLTERVYYHHAKVIAGAMISRGLELALQAGKFDKQSLFELRDDSLLYILWTLREQVEGLGAVVEDLSDRRLYQRAYMLTLAGLTRPGLSDEQRDSLAERFHTRIDERQRLETEIAERLGIPPAHVIAYCPSPKMQLKEANVPVEVAPGEVRSLSSLGHPDVEALKEKHRGLWRFYVLVRRGGPVHEAGALCEELIGYRNQLVWQSAGKLAFNASVKG